MNDLLLTEFNKTALGFVDLYAILEGYLKEESEYYKQNNNVFQYMEKSSLLFFFDNNDFNHKYSVEDKRIINGTKDGSGVKILRLYIENKDENELFSIDQAVEGGNKNPEENQISIKYKKVIGDILITKKIYLKRLKYQEKIQIAEYEAIVSNVSENIELVNYSFKYDRSSNAEIIVNHSSSVFCNRMFLDMSKELERNNGIKESFFEMSDLKYDFKNMSLIKILLNIFSEETIYNDKEKVESLITNYDNNLRGFI